MSMKLPTLQERNDRYVRRVFRLCGGKVGLTAKTLGIGRATLYRWLTKLGVDFDARQAERELDRRIKHLGREARTM
jgi:DNA-binding NtrC family response regulator